MPQRNEAFEKHGPPGSQPTLVGLAGAGVMSALTPPGKNKMNNGRESGSSGKMQNRIERGIGSLSASEIKSSQARSGEIYHATTDEICLVSCLFRSRRAQPRKGQPNSHAFSGRNPKCAACCQNQLPKPVLSFQTNKTRIRNKMNQSVCHTTRKFSQSGNRKRRD